MLKCHLLLDQTLYVILLEMRKFIIAKTDDIFIRRCGITVGYLAWTYTSSKQSFSLFALIIKLTGVDVINSYYLENVAIEAIYLLEHFLPHSESFLICIIYRSSDCSEYLHGNFARRFKTGDLNVNFIKKLIIVKQKSYWRSTVWNNWLKREVAIRHLLMLSFQILPKEN